MKEKIIEILKAAYRWGRDNGEGRSNKNFNDFLDTSGVRNIEQFVNQEVERRIAERMPTKIDAQKKIFEICSHPDNIGKGLRGIISTPMKLEMYDEWYRSRLTPQVTPRDTPQEKKTEG